MGQNQEGTLASTFAQEMPEQREAWAKGVGCFMVISSNPFRDICKYAQNLCSPSIIPPRCARST